jgi:mRNA interferase RelE/StbE
MSQASEPYRIELLRAARRGLERLQRRDLDRVDAKILSLANAPRPPGVEKLTDRGDLYRVRSGNFRIVYSIDDRARTVTIESIGDRKDIYRGS